MLRIKSDEQVPRGWILEQFPLLENGSEDHRYTFTALEGRKDCDTNMNDIMIGRKIGSRQ